MKIESVKLELIDWITNLKDQYIIKKLIHLKKDLSKDKKEFYKISTPFNRQL